MRISIVITTYNYEGYIKECVDSCLYQNNFSDYEVIIVDDGSTDNTSEIVKSYQDEKLTYYLINNSGIEYASNYGISKSSGEFIVRVDADDRLHADYLSTMSKAIMERNCAFVYSNYHIVDNHGKTTETSNLPSFNVDEILNRGDFLATGTLFRKSDFSAVGGYSEKVKNCGLENYELIIQLISSHKSGYLIPQALFDYRRHSLNMSEIRRTSIVEYGKKVFKEKGLGQFSTNEYHPYKLKL